MKRVHRKIFKEISIGKVMPNLATISALLVGMMQVKFALASKWEYAVIAVVISAFLGGAEAFHDSCHVAFRQAQASG